VRFREPRIETRGGAERRDAAAPAVGAVAARRERALERARASGSAVARVCASVPSGCCTINSGTAVLFLMASAACRGSSPSSPSGSSSAAISVTASPNPAAGGPCTGCGAQSTDREVVTQLTIQETGGLAATVTSVAMTLRENGTSVTIASGAFDTDAASVSLAGSSRLAANGTLVVRNVGVHYPREQIGKAATLTYTVTVRDDRGNTVTQTLAVPVSST
jgi:hypothetical protein